MLRAATLTRRENVRHVRSVPQSLRSGANMPTDFDESSRKRTLRGLSDSIECPEQWRIDVNNKYQNAVGVVISLATGAMVLPILFLREIVKDEKRSLAHLLNLWAYTGWILLSLSILSGILYHFCSAKWVKLA